MKKIFTLFFISYLALGCSTRAIANEQAPKQMTLYIKEMTCQLCAYLVNKTLRDIDGVISTKAIMKDHLVNIVAEPYVTDQQIFQAIEKLHYTAEIVKNPTK